jgi:hypothetical protein
MLGCPRKRTLSLLLAVLLSLVLPTTALAANKTEICVKFRKNYGWSQGYIVQGTVISGTDLNSAVGSFNRFKNFSTYVVVFWDQNQASIFELPGMTMGSVPIFETEVEDQQGRKWKIKEGRLMCY